MYLKLFFDSILIKLLLDQPYIYIWHIYGIYLIKVKNKK
jgi:hypothetical protein